MADRSLHAMTPEFARLYPREWEVWCRVQGLDPESEYARRVEERARRAQGEVARQAAWRGPIRRG